MAQNDFSSLALDKQCEPDLTTTDPICKQSTCSGAGEYIPVNFIPDEVLAMLKAWETTQLKRLELKGASAATSQDVSTAVQDDTAQEAYEPLRYITDGTPPKRFFRTFWMLSLSHCFNIAEPSLFESPLKFVALKIRHATIRRANHLLSPARAVPAAWMPDSARAV